MYTHGQVRRHTQTLTTGEEATKEPANVCEIVRVGHQANGLALASTMPKTHTQERKAMHTSERNNGNVAYIL